MRGKMAGGVEITVEVPDLLLKNTLANKILATIEDSGMEVLDELCKWIQKSIKLRAPRASGHLAESINIQPTGKNEMGIFGADYAVYQSEGYEPHDVSVWWHSGGYPTYFISDWLEQHGTFALLHTGASVKVSKFKPGYIDAGIEAGFENLDDIIDKIIIKKMRKTIDDELNRKKKLVCRG